MGGFFRETLSGLASGAVLLVICVAVEFASPRRPYTLKERLPGVAYWLMLSLFSVAVGPIFAGAWFALGIKPLFSMNGWSTVPAILALVLAMDFFNYWQHRFDHRFVWPVHAVHHSVRELHALNSIAHPFQLLSELLMITAPLALIGLGGVVAPAILMLLMQLQARIIHCPTNVNYGPLWRVFVDNRFHRIHHSLEERHFGKNYGTVFSIWDQMFGTAYYPAKDEWPDVGLADYDPPLGLWDYLTHPLRHFPAVSKWTRRYFAIP